MDTLREFWALIAGGVAALGWLMRLEARGLANEREIKRLWTQRKEDLDAAQRSRDEANKMLDEIRKDVKLLLRQRGSGE
jgi:hypothetical protein